CAAAIRVCGSPPADAERAQNVRLVRRLRDWDAAFWPHAAKGFFGLKKQIPDVLRALGVGGG
ncbi:MAG: hypothetical protein AAFV51_14695, partial [Pseudomonadota bacterium]